ncbi:MAG: MATE family efflux transporter [Clostridiales bacterium]|nr:MATE family efflux transporter [Clostridiales bacterium]
MSERTKAQGRFNKWLCGLFDSEMFTTKELLGMFFPLLLDQFSIHIIGVLSSSLVSSVGQEAIAAVSMVNSMGFLVTAVMFALGAGGGVVIAQAKGSGDEKRLRHAVGNTTMLATGCMLVLSTLLYTFAEPVVGIIYPNAEPILKEYAVHYLKLNMLSQVPYAVFHAIFTSFRSVGDSKSSLVLTIFINVSHLLLSLLFINVLGMGVTGSGLSLIVARSIGCVVALIWIFRPRGYLHISVHDFFKWDLSTVKPIVKLGIPFCIEQILFQGGMLMVQGYLSSWGDTPQMGTMALAAHAVASSLMNLYQASANCVTTMTGTVCGQCIGAGKIELCKRYNRSMIKGGRLVLLITVLVLFPLSPLLLKLYHPNPDAMGIIYSILAVAVLPMPIVWCNAFVTPTMLRSAGDVKYTTYVSLLVMVIGRVVLGYIFTIVFNLGPVGVWLGMLVEWLIRVVLMEKRFKSGKWTAFIEEKYRQKPAG